MDFYNKYHFTFHDVIKRHERILNRSKDWEIRIVACMFLIVTIINLLTLSVFCVEEENVDYNVANNLTINANYNYFTYSDTRSVGYITLDKNYIYTITSNYDKHLAFSNDIPSVNVVYDYIEFMTGGDSFSFIPTDEYLYFDFDTSSSVTITRRPINGMNDSVNGLVENVGINQLWGVFENGVSFVGVVVLVAFGLFLVVLAIRRVTKGKSEF